MVVVYIIYIRDTVQGPIESFTVNLHSPNGRHLPAVRVCKGTVSGH